MVDFVFAATMDLSLLNYVSVQRVLKTVQSADSQTVRARRNFD